MRTITVAFGSVALVVAMAVSADDEQLRTLRGNYAVSGSTNCVFSNAIFPPPGVYVPPAGFTNLAPIGHASTNSSSLNGIWSFNKDGTGTIAQRVVSLGDPDPGDSGAAAVIDTSSDFTYGIADDGTITMNQGPINSVFVAGPRAGFQSQTSGVPPLVGHASTNKSTLVFGTFNPGVETTTRVVPDFGFVESLRICHRAFTAVRIDSDPDR